MIVIKKVKEGLSFKVDVNKQMSDTQLIIALSGLEAQIGAMFSLNREELRILVDEISKDVQVEPEGEEIIEAEVD